jgi:methionyl-tRNA formyltransferase
MNIIFIGCVKSSEMFLKKLIEDNVEISGVITKSKSDYNSDFVDLGKICNENKIDYLYVRNINDLEAKIYISNKKPDLILCLGWSQLIGKDILDIPKKGCVGFHPAELPYNRGRHPLIWALALGLERTASTLFMLNEYADAGDIVSQEYVDIDYSDDAARLYEKIMDVAVRQLSVLIQQFETDTVSIIHHFEKGNSWRKREKSDGKIDWRMSSRNIYNLVRALSKPYIGAHFVYNDAEIKIWKVKEIIDDNYRNIEPGKIIKVISNKRFIVKAGDNLIEVLDCDSIDLVEGVYLPI